VKRNDWAIALTIAASMALTGWLAGGLGASDPYVERPAVQWAPPPAATDDAATPDPVADGETVCVGTPGEPYAECAEWDAALGDWINERPYTR
jgi:hypothetical protein